MCGHEKNKKEKWEGKCFCGEVRYIINMSYDYVCNCFCLDCQKISGGALITWVGFKREYVKIEDKNNNLKILNGQKANRGFCSNCGTVIYMEYKVKGDNFEEGEMAFSKNSLSGSHDIMPTENIYTRSYPYWLDGIGNLQRRD